MKVPFFKTAGERRVEALTLGSLLVWVGVVVAWDEPPGIASIVAGGIMLGSAVLQRAMGWDAGLILWVGGIAFLISGINDRLGEKRDLPALAIVLILIGVWIIARGFRRTSHGARVTIVRDREPPDRPV